MYAKFDGRTGRCADGRADRRADKQVCWKHFIVYQCMPYIMRYTQYLSIPIIMRGLFLSVDNVNNKHIQNRPIFVIGTSFKILSYTFKLRALLGLLSIVLCCAAYAAVCCCAVVACVQSR